MSSPAHRAARGQATVEHVGLVALMAVLLSATGLWLVREVRPPAHPPRFVDAAAQPLESADSWVGRNLNPLAGLQPWRAPLGGIGPIGRALRDAGAVLVGGVVAFNRGTVDRLLEHLDRMLHDPLDTLLVSLRGAYWAGSNPDEAALAAVRDLRAYVRDLRRAGWREAYLRLAHDAGAEAIDLALARGQAQARRLILRRLAERLPARAGAGGP